MSQVLSLEATIQMRRAQQRILQQGGMFMMPRAEDLYFVLKINRSSILEDTLMKVVNIEDKSALKRPLKVKFIGEPGVDQGGVKKEFFQILIQQLLDPQYGKLKLEVLNNSQKLTPPSFLQRCSRRTLKLDCCGSITTIMSPISSLNWLER